MARMDEDEVEELISDKFCEVEPADGRAWYVHRNIMEPKKTKKRMVTRGEGSFAKVQTFGGYSRRKGLCVKVQKFRWMEAGTAYSKKKNAMFVNELGALARASAASLPGVVELVACPIWKSARALVMEYHGKVTLKKALRGSTFNLDASDMDDITGQLVQTAIHLNYIGVAHNNINPKDIMVEREQSGGRVSYRATLIDFGTATVLSDDGTSEPPLKGLRKYTDPQISFARTALRNDYNIPTGGRVKGIHSDMFSIAKVATKMYNDLLYDPDNETVSLTSDNLRDRELLHLLRQSASPIWNERLDAEQVERSAFMQSWAHTSRYSMYQLAAEVAPEPVAVPSPSPPVVHEHEHEQEQEQEHHDFAQPVSDGGGGSSSPSGDGDPGENRSGVQEAAEAAADASPAAAAAAAAVAAAAAAAAKPAMAGEPGKRRLVGDETRPGRTTKRSRHGQGMARGSNIAGASAAAGGSGTGGEGSVGRNRARAVRACVSAATAASAARAEAATASAAKRKEKGKGKGAGTGTGAAATRGGGVSVAARGASSAEGSRKRRHEDEDEENDEGQSPARSKRRGCGGGSGGGANTGGATGESAAPVMALAPVPAPTKSDTRPSTKLKTVQSLEAQDARAAANKGSKTSSGTAATRKRAGEAAAGEANEPSKRPRRR